MSENRNLKGKINKLHEIHGYSAYELAVINGFKGSEAEWLDSLKADFDERADDAKASIDAEVENVIVPKAIAEITATTESEKQKVTDVGNEAVDVIKGERRASIAEFEEAAQEQAEILKAVAKTADAKEELLWENYEYDNPSGNGWPNNGENVIDTAEPGAYDSYKIFFVESQSTSFVLPAVELRANESGAIQHNSDINNICRRDITCHDASIYISNEKNGDNHALIPYKIYGVKKSAINLPGAFGEFVTDTPGISNNKVMSQKAACGSFMGALKETVEGKDVTIDDIAEAPHGVEVSFHSKNMFNEATIAEKRSLIITPNERYELGDLGTAGSDNKFVSDFIKVEEGKTYHINYIYNGPDDNRRFYVVGYDADKKGVVCLYNKYDSETPYDDVEKGNFTVPYGMGIKYIRFQGLLEDRYLLQMELGTVGTDYESYIASIAVTSTDGNGNIIDSKTIPADEEVAFESVYPVMKIYTLEAATLKVRYNVEINSAFASEGEEWGE